MNKFIFKKWKCVSVFPAIMKESLALLETMTEKDAFKIKEDRIIFNFRLGNKCYFAKKNVPKQPTEKIKEFFRPQSRLECNIGLLLNLAEIPAVNMIGWAKNGTTSILISECPEGKVATAREFWLTRASSNRADKQRFFSALSIFIKAFLSARLIHPDLHLGNLLAVEKGDDLRLVIVDPFGIKFFKGANYNLFKGGLALLLYALKSSLNEEEKKSFFLAANLIKSVSEFDATWTKIIEFTVKHHTKNWKGRRREKILTRNTRFTEKIDEKDGSTLFVRKGIDGKPLFSKDEILNANSGLIEEKTEKAEQKWLFSLYLQTLEIDHVKPAAWLKKVDGQNILFNESKDEFLPYKKSEYENDFLQICEFSGIKIKSPAEDILLRGDIPCLKNSDPAYWNKANL